MVENPNPSPPFRKARTSRVVLLAAWYAILGGGVTLAGWALAVPRLTDWLGRNISMFPNTALCSIACGATLLLGVNGPAWRTVAARACAALVVLIGGLTLLQHLVGVDFRIDSLLFQATWGQRAAMAPMRMGVPASSSFLILGSALLLATCGARSRATAALLAILPVAIASVPLVGYLFGADQLFGIARFSSIAWQTATILFVLGIGLVAALPDDGIMPLLRRRDAGGVAMRRLLPAIIAIPLLLGWLRVAGVDAGLFDSAFGTALRSIAEIAVFFALLYWTCSSISRHAAAADTAASALRASEERFTRFMTSLPGLAWIKDRSGRYVYANDAALRAFQQTNDTLLGRTDRDFLPAPIAEAFIRNDAAALASGEGVQVIETLEHADGVLHSSLVSKFPIAGAEGGLVGGIAIDITDRLRAEEALKEAYRRKDEFLAILAHELRNPLAPIRFAIHLLKEDPVANADTLDIVERQIRHMARLLEDLLDVSRISHGKLTLRTEPVELAEVLDQAVETSRPLLEAGGHDLAVELPPAAVHLDADPVRLAQIFSNLLNNAARHTRHPCRIVLRAEARGNEAHVSVSDDGAGIAPEMLPHIFEMFSQGHHPQNPTGGGLGIGLSLVRGLVELHGGRIEARSPGPGRGSTFLVRLPTASAQAIEPSPEPDAVPLAGRRRILIADDLHDNANSMAALFRTRGHEVAVAYDGEQALATAESFRPEIILLDIGMPGLSGHDVCRKLREESWGRVALVIAITGWGQESDHRLTAEAGFDHHLVKPVDVAALERLIAGTLRSTG
jgi:PAS domain S-box-containing protein